jgi:hypothetical protein
MSQTETGERYAIRFSTKFMIGQSRQHGAHVKNAPLSFSKAEELFGKRKKGRSLLLRPNVRLVQLSPDRYGVQVHNTYLVRVDKSGAYVIAFGGEPTPDILQALVDYSPVTLARNDRGQWVTQHGDVFKSPMICDISGNRIASA